MCISLNQMNLSLDVLQRRPLTICDSLIFAMYIVNHLQINDTENVGLALFSEVVRCRVIYEELTSEDFMVRKKHVLKNKNFIKLLI